MSGSNGVAPRPEPRQLEVGIAEGRFAGWKATVRIDWPAALVEEFDSGDMARILAAADVLIVKHNFPDTAGKLATRLADVDPFTGIAAVIQLAMGASKSLPPE